MIIINKKPNPVGIVTAVTSGTGPIIGSPSNMVNAHEMPSLSNDGIHSGQGAVTLTMKGGSTAVVGVGGFITC